MAVTTAQVIRKQCDDRVSVPVAASVSIPEGSLVFVTTAGYATNVIAAGANVFVGIAIANADNSAGSAGDISVEAHSEGIFELEGSSFAQTTVGESVYATDNYTLTTTSTNNSLVGTCVGYVSATKILVNLRHI